ncbi:unnamed protein product [Phytophthora fragariaefolia]|uniref:Unnamed protein product n=1 Tax=Phytophthora fragariaefolia TaxID=1490495 RepID=A0A9W6WVZ4_9STRA|nr:unnamed protein product [Phytophthora fragariaefolia]
MASSGHDLKFQAMNIPQVNREPTDPGSSDVFSKSGPFGSAIPNRPGNELLMKLSNNIVDTGRAYMRLQDNSQHIENTGLRGYSDNKRRNVKLSHTPFSYANLKRKKSIAELETTTQCMLAGKTAQSVSSSSKVPFSSLSQNAILGHDGTQTAAKRRRSAPLLPANAEQGLSDWDVERQRVGRPSGNVDSWCSARNAEGKRPDYPAVVVEGLDFNIAAMGSIGCKEFQLPERLPTISDFVKVVVIEKSCEVFERRHEFGQHGLVIENSTGQTEEETQEQTCRDAARNVPLRELMHITSRSSPSSSSRRFSYF